ncbi:MAG: NapC/NirT family cytochrome c [Candidatus Longimicrobiales bacterium M2_2A_002]
MLERSARYFRNFLAGLGTNRIGVAGIVLTTTAFVLFIFMELLRLVGVVTNAYVGLISYMALPALFILGLVLIPVGWRRYRKGTGRSTRELLEARFDPELLDGGLTGSKLLAIVSGLTVINVLFLSIGGARTLHFMDTPTFCGTACHEVMNPEWTVYQTSAHARVACVECHVGEGVGALVDSKLNGLWQVVSATFDLYERPIPTPVHQLRPARETCEHCHWPSKFYGERVVTRTTYGFDSAATPTFTTLSLKVGSGTEAGEPRIHWHIAERNRVRYTSVDDERETMIWVESLEPDGSWRRWTNRSLAAGRVPGAGRIDPDTVVGEPASGAERPGPPVREARTMDCVDCHNRATHIYEDPERAIDERLASGEISTELPYVKKVAYEALTTRYRDIPTAMRGIDRVVHLSYDREVPGGRSADPRAVESLVGTLQEIYRRNIHPEMRVYWNPYPDHSGHAGGTGCFRCHSPDLVDADGEAIVHECTLCHSIAAWDSPAPFHFLQDPKEADPESEMHEWLREEFVRPRP